MTAFRIGTVLVLLSTLMCTSAGSGTPSAEQQAHAFNRERIARAQEAAAAAERARLERERLQQQGGQS